MQEQQVPESNLSSMKVRYSKKNKHTPDNLSKNAIRVKSNLKAKWSVLVPRSSSEREGTMNFCNYFLQ